MEDLNIPKWVFRLFSHISAFTYGIYVYATVVNHDPPELYRWVITGLLGIFFFVSSLPDKK